MGAMARDCPIGVEMFVIVVVVACVRFPQTLAKGCVWFGVCVLFQAFLSIAVCVE